MGAHRIAALGSLAAAALCAALLWLARSDPDAYYRLLQEDGALEWATVFALLGAAGCFARSAWLSLRARRRSAWFEAALALFSAFVALEEISWGQRLIGYRPPAYFLEHNFQQELNLHNVASRWLRELVLIGVLGVWGALLPVALRARRLAGIARRSGLFAPTLALAPGFAASLALYLAYPVPFSGEIAELLLGIGLLLVALGRSAGADALGWWAAAGRAASALGAVALISFATLGWWQSRPADPARISEARAETEALARDLRAIARERGAAPTGCGLHKRLFSFVREYGVGELSRLDFAGLAERGADPDRIAYFLDPWNSPYWARDECGRDGRRSAFVYSFGPDRRRDSSAWELAGDDVGAYLVGP